MIQGLILQQMNTQVLTFYCCNSMHLQFKKHTLNIICCISSMHIDIILKKDLKLSSCTMEKNEQIRTKN